MRRKIANLVEAIAEGLIDKSVREKLAALRLQEDHLQADLQTRIDDIMASHLSREKFEYALTAAKKALASSDPEELHLALVQNVRIDYDLENKTGTCTFYTPLPVTEFSLDGPSPRKSKDRSAPTLYYPRVAKLAQIPFELTARAA